MFGRMKDDLQKELASIRDAGLYKEERFILTPQAADIRVEYPEGKPPQDVVNFCANNYLGLSSHSKVIAAARDARCYIDAFQSVRMNTVLSSCPNSRNQGDPKRD